MMATDLGSANQLMDHCGTLFIVTTTTEASLGRRQIGTRTFEIQYPMNRPGPIRTATAQVETP